MHAGHTDFISLTPGGKAGWTVAGVDSPAVVAGSGFPLADELEAADLGIWSGPGVGFEFLS